MSERQIQGKARREPVFYRGQLTVAESSWDRKPCYSPTSSRLIPPTEHVYMQTDVVFAMVIVITSQTVRARLRQFALRTPDTP